MDIRSAANLPERVRLDFPIKGRAKQSMAAECDINNIMRGYSKTGAISHFAKHSASYGFCDAVSFHEAATIIKTAETMFLDLPSALRNKFEQDPAKFLAFVQDPENLEEMSELGLLARPLPTPEESSKAPDAPAAKAASEEAEEGSGSD